MTTKGGQKCTAIRRALVPTEYADAAAESLAAALAQVSVGDPRLDNVDMGPLASRAQRAEVEGAVAHLSAFAERVGTSQQLIGEHLDDGCFVHPVLLRATDSRGEAIHATEAFGPVATLVPYTSIDDAIDLVGLGRGSLVASVYGSDPTEIRDLTLGIAAHHGRVLIADQSMAAASTGHGSPLPHLVHGGPGRAGGGEEMGGMRGVFHHMQRTAVQGGPDMLTAVTGEYVTGAAIREQKGHPFRLTFDDLEIGDAVTTESRVVSRQDIADFAEATGDTFYAHMDEEAASRSPIFGGLVAH